MAMDVCLNVHTKELYLPEEVMNGRLVFKQYSSTVLMPGCCPSGRSIISSERWNRAARLNEVPCMPIYCPENSLAACLCLY